MSERTAGCRQMTPTEAPGDAHDLLARLKTYCLPGGEDAARRITAIRTTQRGEIRAAPDARWNAFTAEETVHATRTAFRWEAQMDGNLITSVSVTDAYEDGRGRLVLRKGPIPLKKLLGPEVDKGELQRYLAYVEYCPPMLLNNPSLEFSVVGPRTLRVSDRSDRTGAWVDMDVGEDGRPLGSRAVRPMTVGSRIVRTPWSASGSEPQEREGLRIPRRLEASWIPPEGKFTYVRMELTSFTVLR